MRKLLILSTLSACIVGGSAGAVPQQFRGMRNLHVNADVNVATWDSHWTSSGAFIDSGTIDPDKVSSFHGAAGIVTGPLHGTQGSFSWTFVVVYTGPLNGGRYRAQGTWTMVDGTDAYEGISGQGTISGWWDQTTRDVHLEFDGGVDCPNCP
jgi:hypothetical protein